MTTSATKPSPDWTKVLDYLTGAGDDPGDLGRLPADLADRFKEERPGADPDELGHEAERMLADYLARPEAEPSPELRRLLLDAPDLAAVLAELRQDVGRWRGHLSAAAEQLRPPAPAPAAAWGADGTLLGTLTAALDKFGKVVATGLEQFFGPRLAAGAAMAPGDPGEARWVIPVPDRGYSVTLQLKPIEGGAFWQLGCNMEGPAAAANEAAAEVEVRVQGGKVLADGPFALLRATPIRVSPGDLRVKLTVGADWRVILVRAGGPR